MSPRAISPLLRAWYRWKMLRLPWRRQFLVGLDLDGNTYWEFLDRGARLPSPPSPSSPAPSLGSPTRWRRIVRYPRGTHPADVQVPPAWHQWLRHTRADPPSLAEQRAEAARRERIRELAAQADARWEAKPRVLDRAAAQLGVRQPAFQTERDVGPGSKVKAEAEAEAAKAVAEGERKGVGVTDGEDKPGPTGVTDEDTLGDAEAANQREETWRRMQREEEEAERKKAKTTEGKGPDPWRQARGGPSEKWQPQAWDPTAKPRA